MTTPSPLDGHRVLDIAQAISGPFVGRLLADLGADVVKVEWPNGDVTNRFGPTVAGLTGLFTHMNAGKRGVAIDLKSTGGPDLVRRLASKADVVVENFRPGVLERAGLGYDDLAAANPGLVMVSISGFGRTGPEAQRAAYAPVLHAESGLLARLAAFDERPVSDIAISLADQVAGLHACVAVLAALHLRTQTGRGQHIDVSMLEALVATDDHVSDAIDGSQPADSRGSVWSAPGGPMLISVDPKTLWHRLSRHVGLEDKTTKDTPLKTKIARRTEVIADWISSFSDRHALIAQLEATGLAWADVRDASNLFESPSLRASDAVADVDNHDGGHRGVIRMPYGFSAATSAVRGPAPRRGQHNDEVLADWLGLAREAVERLVADGTIEPPAR